jgi:hypothetical protein
VAFARYEFTFLFPDSLYNMLRGSWKPINPEPALYGMFKII